VRSARLQVLNGTFDFVNVPLAINVEWRVRRAANRFLVIRLVI
jgi:hypothetical protein